MGCIDGLWHDKHGGSGAGEGGGREGEVLGEVGGGQ